MPDLGRGDRALPARLGGVDAARGLAVLGMFAAHVGNADTGSVASDWLVVADGRSSAVFAVLAGVSLALLSGGARAGVGGGRDVHAGVGGGRDVHAEMTGRRDVRAMDTARARITVRALLIAVLGVVLTALGTPVAVILPVYAVLFLTALPVLQARPAWLVTIAAVAALAGPPLAAVVTARVAGPGGGGPSLFARPVTHLLFTGTYPAVVWVAYVLVGLAVGRADLRSVAVRGRLARLGVLGSATGYGGSAVAQWAYHRVSAGPGGPGGPGGQAAPSGAATLLTARAHDDTTFEVVGNTGVALLVLVGCLAAAERFPRLLAPLAATGALALTVYTAQILAIAALGPHVVWAPRNSVLAVFVVTALVASTVWRRTLGRGPLERVLHTASMRAAASLVRDQVARAATGGRTDVG